MLKLPYFLEGILNIFKPTLTEKNEIKDIKGCESYRGKVVFNMDLCKDCSLCIEICPSDAISREIINEEKIKLAADIYSCVYCGTCRDYCPSNAITMENNIIVKDKTPK